MEAQGLIDRLRRAWLDDTSTPYLWEDEELFGHLNEAVKQACLRKRALHERDSTPVCHYPLTAGVADVTLHPAVLAVRTARLASGGRPLTLITLRRMDRMRPDWPDHARGTPTHLILDAQERRVTLYPTPAVADTLKLAVWRMPLESERIDAGSDEPVIDPLYHEDLLDWVAHLAFAKPDSETQDLQRSAVYAERFTAKFGSLPDARAVRLWGLSPRVPRPVAFD